jgi:DNA polymerase III subunit delta'
MARAPAVIDEPQSDIREGLAHPRFAQQVLGQAAAEAAFLAQLQAGRLHHAWILAGPEGIGKASMAWRMARYLLAATTERQAQSLETDRSSHTARLIDGLAHPDLVSVRRRWNEKSKKFYQDIAVDDIRAISHLFQRAAGQGGYRVVIIDACDDLNGSSANALLKMLEEPPKQAIFFLVAHQPAKLLPTIRSRCRKIALSPLSDLEVTQILAGQGVDAGLLNQAVPLAGGSVSGAMRWIDGDARQARERTLHLLSKLPKIDTKAWLALSRDLSKRDHPAFGIFLRETEAMLHRFAVAPAANPAHRERLAAVYADLAARQREVETFNLDGGMGALAILQTLSKALQ